MPLSLKDVWPKEANAQECLMTEAESASDALFLAVHQPMRLRQSAYQVNSAGVVKEEGDLLKAFLAETPPSGTRIVPIVGSSGIGKSHLVRWLDAHLRRRSDRQKRHIVRIPKSASLKRVLELMLDGLPESRYGALRDELTGAVMPPDLLSATRGLQAKLLVRLERNYQEARQRISAGAPRSDDAERQAHCAPSSLQALIQDPEVSAHFTAYRGTEPKGVLARIAERYIEGSHGSDTGPDNVFTAADLNIPQNVNRAHMAHTTRVYLNFLAMQNGAKRAVAVRFLNEIVDSALGELLDFHGSSLTDLFVRARQQFQKDKLELVLLIEDFATLAGIQGSLLDAISRPNRDQEQLCTMRTALAVTSGYLSQWETITTRAEFEWKIEEDQFHDNEDALEHFTDFVASYLNAARWGHEALKKRFAAWEKEGEDDLQGWIPDFLFEHRRELTEDIKHSLEMFGKSPSKQYSLFPFNKNAIHQLARRYLSKDGRDGSLRFLPRLLINRILRDTIILHRPFFDRNQFPPPNLHGFRRQDLEPIINEQIDAKGNHEQADRIAALLFFWGDAPHDPTSAANCDEQIYRSFGLEPIQWGISHSGGSKAQKEKRQEKRTGKGPEDVPETDDGLGPWKEKLRVWRTSGSISQPDANRLRGFLAEAIEARIDWDALLLKPTKIRNSNIRLPKVSIGNPSQQEEAATAATDEDWEDASRSTRFFRALEAVIRYHDIYKTWDYDGAEKDSAAYGWLVGNMTRQAERYFHREGHKVPRQAVIPLTQALLLDARLLNLPGASSNTDVDLVAAIFRLPAAHSTDLPQSAPDTWDRLLYGAGQCRQELRDFVLLHVAARQGGADKVQAVDASLLLQAIQGLRSSWKMVHEVPLDRTNMGQLPREHLRLLKNSLESAVRQRQVKLLAWRKKALAWLGDSFDTRAIVEELREVALEARRANVFRCGELADTTIRERVRELEQCRLKETLDNVARATANDVTFGVALSALAQADDRTIATLETVMAQYDRFFHETGEKVDNDLANSPPSLIQEANSMKTTLAQLASNWERIGKLKLPTNTTD